MSVHTFNVEEVDKVKAMGHERIVEILDVEGYPGESNALFQEANVSDVVLAIIVHAVHAEEDCTSANYA